MTDPPSNNARPMKPFTTSMTTANIVSRASVGFSAPVDITNATIATSSPVIVSVRRSVPAGSPSRWATTSAWRTIATADARMTPQMITSTGINNTG